MTDLELTQRGFKIYGRIKDKYASDVRVQQSSGISGGVWIFTESERTDDVPLLSRGHVLKLIWILLRYLFDWRAA